MIVILSSGTRKFKVEIASKAGDPWRTIIQNVALKDPRAKCDGGCKFWLRMNANRHKVARETFKAGQNGQKVQGGDSTDKFWLEFQLEKRIAIQF